MSLPRHFSQRPRLRLAPPPQRGVSSPVPPPEVETVVVEPEAAPLVEATPVVVEPEATPVVVEETPLVEEIVVEPAPVVVEPAPVVTEPPPVVVEPVVVESVVEPKPVAAPKWDAAMKKADLLLIAQGFGLAVTDMDTKADIIAALRTV